MPWSKSISMTRSAITHSRPIDTCWKAEIVHSWPITVFAPIETTPSWQRIFVPCPSHDQRPSSIRPCLPISSTTRGPMNASPSSFSRGANSLRRASRSSSRAYFGVSMRWRRMKRSSVGRPPWSGGGGPRSPSPVPVGGGPAIASVLASSMRLPMLFAPLVPLPPVPPLPTTAAELAERLLAGEKRALARAISLVENDDPEGWALVREVFPKTGQAAVVGFTGPPGVGKSTLIGALVKSARERERKVAVLSIDPSSPFTKGALLGDRIRLTDHFLDPGVFIRSMASRGSLGGLSEATLQAALLMDAAGNDDVLLETVGVGQAEVDIIDHADTVVLVLMPGSGDSIQALKAGVMEIPDVIVVNKSDHPLTDTMIREIRGVLSLGPRTSWRVPIVRTEASRGEGVDELVAKLEEHREHIRAEGTLEERRRRNLRNEGLEVATIRLRRRLEESIAEDASVQELLDQVVTRRLDPASAAARLLEREI